MKKLLIVLCLFLTACTKQNVSEPEIPMADVEVEVDTEDDLLDVKIGSMFMVAPEALSSAEKVQELTEEMKILYEKYPCGGFILFGDNIDNEEQLTDFTRSLHDLGDNVLVAIDEEGGSVSRIANNPNFNVERFSNMESISQKGDGAYAYEAGYKIGQYLRAYGIDLDLAPVADINTNENNVVIGNRAFGGDPYNAATMVQPFIFGLHDNDIMSCAKHFPGHGNTQSDSHKEVATTDKSWDELKEQELIPFMGAILADSEFVMVGHICVPAVTNDETPASLSKELVTDKLREELGYEGLIITDSLQMGAITHYYDDSEAVIMAINAGVDVVLMPINYVEAFEAVKAAVNDGQISIELINESYERKLNILARYN